MDYGAYLDAQDYKVNSLNGNAIEYNISVSGTNCTIDVGDFIKDAYTNKKPWMMNESRYYAQLSIETLNDTGHLTIDTLRNNIKLKVDYDENAAIMPSTPKSPDIAQTSTIQAESTCEVYVSPNGSDTTGNGTTNSPFKTITKGINFAALNNCNAVKVAEGTYYESIAMANGVSILGGYSSDFNTRDWTMHKTKIDGSGSSRCILAENINSQTKIEGLTIQNGYISEYDNWGPGIYSTNCSSNLIINDNEIKSNYSAYGGGGIALKSSSVQIYNNKIINNNSASGAGIYLSSSAADIHHNEFKNNSGNYGAAIYSYQSVTEIHDNIIAENSSLWGNGIYMYESNTEIYNNQIKNNVEDSGLIYFDYAYSYNRANIHDNIINNNSGNYGIYGYLDESNIYNNQIESNSSIYLSGIVVGGYENPLISANIFGNSIKNNENSTIVTFYNISRIYNNIIEGNNFTEYNTTGIFTFDSKADIYNNVLKNNISSNSPYVREAGSGISCEGQFGPNGTVKIINNTLINNDAEVIYLSRSHGITMINNIISGNNANTGVYKDAGSSISEFKNNCFYDIQNNYYFNNEGTYITNEAGLNSIGGTDASGNIVSDPLMDTDNMHLLFTSPCIDAGIDAVPYISSLTNDFFGNKRPYPDGGQYDIGASEASLGIVTNAELVCTFEYDAMSRVIMQSNANATFSIYEYDPVGNLRKLIHQKENLDIIEKFCYTYDRVGNRMSMTNIDGPVTYRYDNTYQLTRADYSDGEYEVFQYDVIGNRETYNKNGTITIYNYDIEDRLLQAGDTTYEYDDNGNQIESTTGGVTATYEYNEENLLKKYTTRGVDAEYYYDSFSKRISKSVNGTNTYCVYDGIQFGANVLSEYNGLTNMKVKYVMHPGRLYAPISQNINNTDYYYYKGGPGSIVALADKNANIINKYKYYSFGESKTKIEIIENSFQYTSQQIDKESEFYNYKSRMFNPVVGRFIQKDKALIGINIYKYVNNNPIIYLDRLGYSWCHDDFVSYYYTGGGVAIDLGDTEVDLLSDFQGSASVENSVQNFAVSVEGIVADEVTKKLNEMDCDAGDVDIWRSGEDDDNTNVENDGCLFSIGNSDFSRKYGCSIYIIWDIGTYSYNYVCELDFSIEDKFKDPLGDEIGELPLATLYDIDASWTIVIQGSESKTK